MTGDRITELLDRHGRTYAEELGIDVTANTPAPLFRLLCFSLLAAARRPRVHQRDFPRLVAALVRVGLAGDDESDAVRQAG